MDSTMADPVPTHPLTKPHFLKPVVSDLATNFLIPDDICKYLEGERCQLRSRRRRQPWAVRIEGRRMVDGWEQFVKENDLHVGEFLLFRYEGHMLFDVTVLCPTACEREFPLPADEGSVVVEEDGRTPELEENTGTDGKRRPYCSSRVGADSFVGRIRPSYMKNLYFPITFVLEQELLRTNSGILIKDENGKTWPMKLYVRRDSNVVYTQKLGWRSFVKENGIMEGDEFEVRVISKGIKPVLTFHRINVKQTPQMSDHGNIQNVNKVSVPETEVVPEPSLKRQKTEVPENASKSVSTPADKLPAKEFSEYKTEPEETPSIPATRLNVKDHKPTTSQCKQKPYSSSAGSSSHFCQTSTWASIQQSRMNVNIVFARANSLPNRCGDIILKNMKGESWPAKLRYKRTRTQDCYYIGAGWKEFALSNGLGVGCRFKMEIEKPESKVLTMKLCECTHEELKLEIMNDL